MAYLRGFLFLLGAGSLATLVLLFISRTGRPGDLLPAPVVQPGRPRQILQVDSATRRVEADTAYRSIENGAENAHLLDLSVDNNRSKGSSDVIAPSGNGQSPIKISQSDVSSIVRSGGVNLTSQSVATSGGESKAAVANVGGSLHSCTSPLKNLVFLKTHKTGSSTIQNIVYRYGDKHNLIFALPAYDVYMGTPNLFKAKYAKRSPTGKYNMLANHARYNRPEMSKVMYPGAVYITILRHPSLQYESMYTYYGFDHLFKVSLSTFANNPQTYYTRHQGPHPMHSALNPTLYDLGLSKTDLTREDAIRKKIETLDAEFDLVLIAEHTSESLILLKDRMCWDFEDVTHFTLNARTQSEVKTMSERTSGQLYKWNRGDALLYEHFNRTLWRKIDAYGRERMRQDVKTLEAMNQALMGKCLGGTKTEKFMKTVLTRHVLKDSALNDEQCIKMTLSAPKYLNNLRKKQASLFGR
ncbi:galactose-3-O-sulfotransferase 2-like [Diadema setosum]|uniref:galactose-3-O-sulfotransferase 2-like n=1 Tax=Diadema setosum TaxID=31175 RepID=UPI003B3ABFD8